LVIDSYFKRNARYNHPKFPVLDTLGVRVYSYLLYLECTTHAPYYIVICVCPALPYFATLSHKTARFSENAITGHKMCFYFI